MSNLESSLPENWVERIFATMRATYGATFDRQWECPPGVDVATHMTGMKAHWGRELRHLQQNPEAVRYALNNLPEYPPNLIQFKALCNGRPEAAPLALPAPKQDEAFIRSIVTDLAERRAKLAREDWAGRLKQREESGEKLTEAQRRAWREAIVRHEPGVCPDKFNPVPPEALPPAMRTA